MGRAEIKVTLSRYPVPAREKTGGKQQVVRSRDLKSGLTLDFFLNSLIKRNSHFIDIMIHRLINKKQQMIALCESCLIDGTMCDL